MVGFMFPSCVLQNFLWCLPWKLPYGCGHYATGPELVILSNLVCIEQSLTNLSCNLLGCAPKAPSVLNTSRKEIKPLMSQGYNNWGYNNNCNYGHQEEKKEYFPKCECCCCKYYEKKEEPKKEEPKCKCATLKVCIEEDKKEEKKDDKKDDCCC